MAKERTLTAMRSPFADGETPSVPVLFVAGTARPPRPGGARWFILPGFGDRPDGSEVTWIGRAGGDTVTSADPDGVLLGDPLISGRHLRLLRQGANPCALAVEDLGSKNGSYLAGDRVIGRVAWPEGVALSVGEHALVFRMVSPNALLALEAEASDPLGPVATASPALALTSGKLRRLAASGGEILFCGETGVGKEVYARAVHRLSGRSGPFVPINCAALPRELLESELFGHRAGAHSTARTDRVGLIERAAGGTLFLDEIGEMPGDGQAKLLRFLQDREVTPLGGGKAKVVDVLVLAATNQPVAPVAGLAAGHGAVRADLVGRLGASPVVLPPLRDRREDIGALALHVLAGLFPQRSDFHGFDGPAFRALFAHDFPLNVRELQKALAAAVALTRGERPIALADLPAQFAARPTGTAAPARLEPVVPPSDRPSRRASAPGPTALELETLLARHQGNVAEVSRALGRQRAAVWRWIKRFGLGVEQHRGNGGDPDDNGAGG